MLFAILVPDHDAVLVPPALPDLAHAGGCHAPTQPYRGLWMKKAPGGEPGASPNDETAVCEANHKRQLTNAIRAVGLQSERKFCRIRTGSWAVVR
jgi:hypothetical protein